jgi:hypothetical protein
MSRHIFTALIFDSLALIKSAVLSVLLLLLLTNNAFANFYSDISHAYQPDQVKELMAGDVMLPIIEIEAHNPLPLGTAVIITEPFPSGLTLGQGDMLATEMAQKGWNVVISPFQLPPAKSENAPVDVDSSNTPASDQTQMAKDNAMTNSTNEAIHPRSNQLTQHLDFKDTKASLNLQLNALNNYLQDRQGYRLVIAQGMLAASFLSLTNSQPTLQPDTFVAISPFWPERSLNGLVVDDIAQAEYPVLDFSIENHSDWASDTQAQRKISAKNALKMHYRQILIPQNPLVFSLNPKSKSSHIQIVTNHTIGWTRHLGW